MTWDEVPTPEDELNIAQRDAIIQRLLDELTQRERFVLLGRFWRDETRWEIAKRAGMTDKQRGTERIRQIEEKAIQRLRHTTRAAKLRPYR